MKRYAVGLAVVALVAGFCAPVTPPKREARSLASSMVSSVASGVCASRSIQLTYGWTGVGPGEAPATSAEQTVQKIIYRCNSTGETMTVAYDSATYQRDAWPATFIPDSMTTPVATVTPVSATATPVPSATPQAAYVSNFHAGDNVQIANGPFMRSGPSYSFPVLQSAPPGAARVVEDCRMDPGGVMPFCHINFSGGPDGWISDEAKYLTLIAAVPTATASPATRTPTPSPTPTATATRAATVTPSPTPTWTTRQEVDDLKRRVGILESK